MEIVINQISRNWKEIHKISDIPTNPSSYSNAILLRGYYQALDISFQEDNDWRYYFIIRRHWLRKQKKNSIWVCHFCGKEIYKMPERNKKCQNLHKCVTVDHKIPKSEGIDILDTSNFLVACYDCNTKKKSASYESFIKGIKKKEKIRLKQFNKVA
jgi:5-methylcytosine-specific restriction endonuclease McrA